MAEVEKINEGRVLALEQLNFQVRHEPADREPEIVPDQDERLQMLAVALTQGGGQLGVFLGPPGMEPLLELVEDQEHLLAARQDAAAS